MNEHVRTRTSVTTQAADGLPRRSFTVHDVERMLEAGILGEHEPFELVGGELVAMAAKGRQHEVLRTELNLYWARRCPPQLKMATETPLRLGNNDEPEPDFIIYPSTLLAPDVRADTVCLVVEIADSSLGLDLGTKAAMYATAGVAEYWVMNARTLVTIVHRSSTPIGYSERTEFAANELIAPLCAADMGVRLASLGIDER